MMYKKNEVVVYEYNCIWIVKNKKKKFEWRTNDIEYRDVKFP